MYLCIIYLPINYLSIRLFGSWDLVGSEWGRRTQASLITCFSFYCYDSLQTWQWPSDRNLAVRMVVKSSSSICNMNPLIWISKFDRMPHEMNMEDFKAEGRLKLDSVKFYRNSRRKFCSTWRREELPKSRLCCYSSQNRGRLEPQSCPSVGFSLCWWMDGTAGTVCTRAEYLLRDSTQGKEKVGWCKGSRSKELDTGGVG
jgi:hypothetical protein